ncbi:hypothetical protein Psfp_03633 [Pelotomaculum sp. FP]|uniref:hypothetical protein n=1 Tax=Pelotomaculum sp. FP TaxID=261474 RepID=UPI0010656C0C|nr:hypothetical protein [Pelotomaculum sp. FP]TEB12895.1 hypothetical protein Psfp_03633 [Pelotomaculum sp. FP]
MDNLIWATKQEPIGAIILFIILLFILLFVVMLISDQFKYLNSKQKKNCISNVLLTHLSGIPKLENGFQILLYLHSDRIYIGDIDIPFSDIINVKYFTDIEITEEQKSVIGRAVVGTMLAGPLGGIVGGMSGLQSSKMKQTVYYLAIDCIYKDEIINILLALQHQAFSNRLKDISEYVNKHI